MCTPSLVVMTYNIRHGRGADGVVDLGRVAAVIASAAPDVVALQEVDRGRARSGGVDQAGELARRLGLESQFQACLVDGVEQYGIATLSRSPASNVRRIALPIRGGRRSEPRFALAIAIPWAGGALELVNTHLSVVPRERPGQAACLVGALVDRTVVVGDLNTWSHTPTFRRLRAALRDTGTRGGSWPARLPIVRLDHLLYRGIAASRSVVIDIPLARRASDHLPVVATFSELRSTT